MHRSRHYFCEVYRNSFILHLIAPSYLPRSRYVVSAQRQFYFEEDVCYDQIAVRHFITPVRHLMYSKGMPKLLPQLQRQMYKLIYGTKISRV